MPPDCEVEHIKWRISARNGPRGCFRSGQNERFRIGSNVPSRSIAGARGSCEHEARVSTGGSYLNSEKQRTEKQGMRAQGSAVAMLRAKTVKSV